MTAPLQLLTPAQVRQKVKRMGIEILEHHFQDKTLYLIGVHEQGYRLAGKLAQHIEQHAKEIDAPLKVQVGRVRLNKKSPAKDKIELDIPLKTLEKQVIIMVDDVANTGRTLTHALKPFLEITTKHIATAVLVDRKHKKFPVCTDYVGLSLATTMQEHIDVHLDDRPKKGGVFLS